VTAFSAPDLSVIIPTKDRWPTLTRTLDALREQTAQGFEVVVVVDGGSECPSDLGVRTIHRSHAGPGAARNAGVAAVSTPLVLFLGDDMVPSPQLVAAHLTAHDRDPAPEAGVLGHVARHPEVDENGLHRWLDWSATQFNYRGLEPGDDAHWARFYSCNVSLKRQLFLDAGGFDPDFVYYYEDLDCGFRLGEQGLRLRYEPEALTLHLHQYDWERLVRRFDGVAIGERMMAAKHDWFTPFFRMRAEDALARRRAWSVWPRVVDHVPESVTRLRALAERRANVWYYRRLAPRYLAAYESAGELQELEDYLGDAYDRRKLWNYRREVEQEEESAANEREFFRTSEAYLYDLTVFALSGTKLPYHGDLERIVPPGSRLLDYGCGIGSDGLHLLQRGYDVEFADFDNPSARYLRWRLQRRGIAADVHDVERDVPSGFDAVYCFDVIEHVDDPLAFLAQLEQHAAVVIVNFLAPSRDDTHLHRPLDIPGLLDYVEQRGLVHHRVYHGRSHLVAYRPARNSSVRSRLERRVGPWRARLEARLSVVRS
jgi:GT2 family glycosyltransferase/2-polyprenyl-3-methyl-5-hydroxy-6-metoxy-1,4-benzoquinol methylase